MSEQGKQVAFDELPADDVKITVSRGKTEFTFYFKALQETVLRRYREIYSGPPGSRRGKPKQAVEYLFKTVFIRSQGRTETEEGWLPISLAKYIEPAEGKDRPEYDTEARFWLSHPTAALWTDAAIDGYLGNQRPEIDDTKE